MATEHGGFFGGPSGADVLSTAGIIESPADPNDLMNHAFH